MKYKVGDKVRCVSRAFTMYVQVGAVYTVKQVKGNYLVFEEIELPHSYVDSRFELVQEYTVLAPEEVFKHLRKGTKLQQLNEHTGVWRDVVRPEIAPFNRIVGAKWRIKPEPEIIELNGKKYQEITD